MSYSSSIISNRRFVAFAIAFLLASEGILNSEAWVGPAVSLGQKNVATTFGPRVANGIPAASGDRRTMPKKTTALFYSSEFFEFDRSNSTNAAPSSPSSVVERLKINGVSVSPRGFYVLLEQTTGRESCTSNPETNGEKDDKVQQRELEPMQSEETNDQRAKDGENGSRDVLPLKMTNNPADAYAATSPESLTLCQLLSGVDMAGAILPPELLGKLVISHIEDKLESLYDYDDEEENEGDETTNAVFTPVLSPIESKLWEYLKNEEALQRERNLFGSKNSQDTPSSRIQMPQITLDQLTLLPSPRSNDGASDNPTWQCKLECAIPQWKERIVVDLQADLLASLVYNYDPESSPLFTCVALALRYKAPIVLKDEAPALRQEPTNSGGGNVYWTSSDELERDFPQRTTLASLKEQSTRVTQNIERGFEIHKLTGALQIAQRLGDTRAAAKIRAKLDEYDSMGDLPTLRAKDEDTSAAATSDDRLEDDLENNILQ